MSHSDGVVKFIRGAAVGDSADVPDAELVRRFAAAGDEAAFRALVARYGPLVWGVCRRLVRDRHDAEDAFQATLLVFARKASGLRADAPVGGWLHAVAWRVAARVRSARRAEPIAVEAPDARLDPLAELTVREAEAALHDELARLPDKYRAPLVLCGLDGLSRDEAAARLGWSTNRVKHGLEQGRERLRARLARRGIALGVPLLTGLLASPAGAVPPALAEAAVHLAIGEVPSAAIHSLANGVTRTMLVAKWKWAVLCVTAVALAGGGALAAIPRPAPEVKPLAGPAPLPEPLSIRAAPPEPKPKPEPKAEPPKFPGDLAIEYLSAIANNMPEKALKMGDDLAKHIREVQNAGTTPTDLSLVMLNDLRTMAVTKRAKLKRAPNADPTDEHIIVEVQRDDVKSPWRVRGNDVSDEKKVQREVGHYLAGEFNERPKPKKAAEKPDDLKAREVPSPWHVADEFLASAFADKTADALKLTVPGTISEKKVGELKGAGEAGKPVAVLLASTRMEVAYELRPREEGVTKPMYLVLMLTRKGDEPWRVKDIDVRDRDRLYERVVLYLAGRYDTPPAKK